MGWHASELCIRSFAKLVNSFDVAAALICIALTACPASAQSNVVLELRQVVLPLTDSTTVIANDGNIQTVDPAHGNYTSSHIWNPPPRIMSPDGFDLDLEVTVSQSSTGGITLGTEVGGTGFDLDPRDTPVYGVVPAGQPGSDHKTKTIRVTPASYLSAGSTAELVVGVTFGPHVVYKYEAVATGSDDETTTSNGDDGQPARHLAAELECPGTIVISALPSLNCHIIIKSWRNSADPVQVILPDALDTYGNHANGLQLLQAAGSQDVFNWTAPYRWGFFLFACPSQQGTGANCFGSVTSPTAQSVDIFVRQGAEEVRLQLNINAVPGADSGAGACGFQLGAVILSKWNEMGGQGGVLGCATSNQQASVVSPAGTSSDIALFQGGAIVQHTSGNLSGAAFEVHGCIASRYLGMGGASSWLGLPISDEFDVEGGRRNDFEGGYVVWDRFTGGCIALVDGSRSMTFEADTNRSGSDFTNFPVVGNRMEICRDACAAEQSCVAYTYVHVGVQGPRGMCWLKSSIPQPTLDGCCISGTKQ